MEYIVGRDDYPTINSALAVAQPYDRIVILPGVYREVVAVVVPYVTLEAPERGVTLDGGYSPLLFGASGYKTRTGRQVKPGELPYPSTENQQLGRWVLAKDQAAILRLVAPDVRVSGLLVRNVCGRGFAVSGDRALLSDCVFDFTYSGTGVVDAFTVGASIVNCTFTRGSVKYFDPTVDNGKGTQTNLIIKRGATDTLVKGCIGAFGYGEGVSADKGSVRVRVEDCVFHDFLHWYGGQNESDDAVWIGNVFLTCEDAVAAMGKTTAADMWVAGNERETNVTSRGPFFTGNLIVGDFKEGLAVSNGNSGRPVSFRGGQFSGNTIVGGPNSRFLLTWGTPPAAPHVNTTVYGNVLLAHPQATGELAIAWQGAGGATWGPNLSTSLLPDTIRSTADVVTSDPVLVNPYIPIRTCSGYDVTSPDLPDVGTTFERRNYTPLPDGPARQVDGSYFGALSPLPIIPPPTDNTPNFSRMRELTMEMGVELQLLAAAVGKVSERLDELVRLLPEE